MVFVVTFLVEFMRSTAMAVDAVCAARRRWERRMRGDQAAQGGRLRADARPRGVAAGARAVGSADCRVSARVPAALCRAER